MTSPKLVFLDTETTGLDRRRHEVWDIGLVLREPGQPDQEHQAYVRPSLKNADPNGLKIGRYYDRQQVGGGGFAKWTSTADGVTIAGELVSVAEFASLIAGMIDGAVVVGIVPDFDAHMMGKWLRKWDEAWTAHYQLVDVVALAAGRLQLTPPWSTDDVLQRFGLKYAEADRHTAIGDARVARDLYDRVMGGETVFDYDQYGSAGGRVAAELGRHDYVAWQQPDQVAGADPVRFERGFDDPPPATPAPAHTWSTCAHGVDYTSEAEHDRDCEAMPLATDLLGEAAR